MKPLHQSLRFVDSLKFMSASVQSLVDSTPAAAFKNTRKVFGRGALDPELYRVIHAESENGRKITLREVRDRRKLEYIVTHPDDFGLGSRLIKMKKLDKNAQLTLMQGYLTRVNGQGESTMQYYQRNGFGRYRT